MYEVGMVNDYIIIYNSGIDNKSEAFENRDYIAEIDTSSNLGRCWGYDTFLLTESKAMNYKEVRGDSIEEIFFNLQLILTEFGFEGIMDLEFPTELLDV